MKTEDFFSQFGNQKIMTLDDDWIVYCLVFEGSIVYIGKSSKSGFWGRIREHNKRKQFDSYFIIDSVDLESDALKLEGGLIALINPKYNKSGLKADGSQIMFLRKWEIERKKEQVKLPAYVRNYPSSIDSDIMILMVIFSIIPLIGVIGAIVYYLFGDEASKVASFCIMVGWPLSFVIWSIKYSAYQKKLNDYASSNI